MSKKKLQLFPRTDSGNAELFALICGETVRFDHKQQRWLVWDAKRGRWAVDRRETIRALMKLTARQRHVTAMAAEESDERTRQIKWALLSENCYRIDAALKSAKSEEPIADDGEGWDADPWLLGVENGIVDLRTGKLRAGTQQDRLTKFSPVLFDAAAKCPRFEKFVSEILGADTDLIRFVQQAVGYTLTGSTKEQCFFSCYGEGSNGKTTFLEIVGHLMGDYSASLPFDALEAKRYGGVPNEGMKLYGMRFVRSVETREGKALDESRIKAWTGSDAVSARPLYRDWFEFRPTHKLWLAFNHKPVISDDSPAMWRRVRLIPFLLSFKDAQKDPDLLDKLRSEASGILNWAIAGCLAWQSEGLEPPAAVADATREYKQHSDRLAPFIEDRCVVDADRSVPSAELSSEYQKWAKQNDPQPLSRSALADHLKRRGFTSGESGHAKQRIWRGLALQVVPDAGARVSAGADSPNYSNNSSIERSTVNGHPQAPADPQQRELVDAIYILQK